MTKNTMAPSKMTAAERTDLRSLIRQRAKLMKAHVAQRGLELMTDFERQLQAIFRSMKIVFGKPPIRMPKRPPRMRVPKSPCAARRWAYQRNLPRL